VPARSFEGDLLGIVKRVFPAHAYAEDAIVLHAQICLNVANTPTNTADSENQA